MRLSSALLALSLLGFGGNHRRDGIIQWEESTVSPALDTIEGFRGITFGSHLRQASDLSLHETYHQTTVWTREDELLRLYGVGVDQVYYIYWFQRFAGAVLNVGDATEVGTRMSEAVQARHGQGIYEADNSRVIWEGERAFLLLTREEDGTALLMVMGREMVEEMQPRLEGGL